METKGRWGWRRKDGGDGDERMEGLEKTRKREGTQAVSIFVSAYTLVAISLDRYLAIIYPLRPRMTRCQAKIIIGVVWAMALLTTLPIPLVSGLHPIVENRVYQHYEYQVCREIWGSEVLRQYYTMALMVLQYFIPLIVIIFTYSR
ncbi:hypothetical protein Pmani_013953 [Petrolisthes manimaculis]|uniref:G-protein coupled receptors family 1 profile domain-containing protein n=1 Tax=Petrolisthes manimaculis TaxID=1843537 RepID=A0AAE1PXB2_9EUCA|nr:hypothetical protein Pmani_013953 [Petrolisthes manimaculis]